MFSGHTRDLPYIRNYTEAKAHWDKTPHNPRSKKWNNMQRPLRNIAQTHYRLETTNPDEYIDVKLYTTTMARYYKPDAHGVQRRLYTGHHTITSRKFMHDVLGVSGHDNLAKLVNGETVHAPIYESYLADLPDGIACSAEFYFDRDNLLIPAMSRHTRHWQVVATDDDKARLKEIRTAWAPYLDLMMYRLPEFEAEVQFNYRQGRPFAGSYVPYEDAQYLIDMNFHLSDGTQPTEESINALVRLAQTMFNGLASKRGYDQKGFVLKHPWSYHNTTPDGYSKLEKPVTAHDLRKSVSNKLEQILSAKRRSGYAEIPQFVAVGSMPGGDRKARDIHPDK